MLKHSLPVRLLWVLSAVLVSTTVACGKNDAEVNSADVNSANDSESTAAVVEPSTSAPTPSPAEDTATDSTAATEPVADAATADNAALGEATEEPTAAGVGAEAATDLFLGLDAAGIQAINGQTGSVNSIAFESDIATAQTVATNVLGSPQETVENGECPAGPLSITAWDNGFALIASGGKFVGWSANPDAGGADLTTAAGIGVGSTRSELEEAYVVEVFESTLGMEFNSGQLSGLLLTDAPDAVITDIWAGTVCNFR